MANYLDVETVEQGERIDHSGGSDDQKKYNTLRQQAGGNFVAVYDRGVFKIAPVIDSFSVFQEFESTYKRGMFISKAYYCHPIR